MEGVSSGLAKSYRHNNLISAVIQTQFARDMKLLLFSSLALVMKVDPQVPLLNVPIKYGNQLHGLSLYYYQSGKLDVNLEEPVSKSQLWLSGQLQPATRANLRGTFCLH